MRVGPSAARLASSASWHPMVSSWLGSSVLADQVPVLGGRVTWTTSQQVIGGLKLRVPFTTVEDGRTHWWRPSSPSDALARFGQTLDVSIVSESVLTRLGRFQIMEWSDDGGPIDVTGAGRLQRVMDDRLIQATAPREDGTLRSEFTRLLPTDMTVTFHPSLVDRACPKAMEWDESRIDALYEIADAWPARLREDSWGQLQMLPPLPDDPTPVLSFTDGEGGTIITAPVEDSREGAFNIFVARSSADGVEAQAAVEVQSGPMAAGGPYGRVPTFFASPLLETVEQCRAAAETRRAARMRQSRVYKVTAAPDPRVEVDDPVELVLDKDTERERTVWGVVLGVDLPLTVHDGPMHLDVGVL